MTFFTSSKRLIIKYKSAEVIFHNCYYSLICWFCIPWTCIIDNKYLLFPLLRTKSLFLLRDVLMTVKREKLKWTGHLMKHFFNRTVSDCVLRYLIKSDLIPRYLKHYHQFILFLCVSLKNKMKNHAFHKWCLFCFQVFCFFENI